MKKYIIFIILPLFILLIALLGIKIMFFTPTKDTHVTNENKGSKQLNTTGGTLSQSNTGSNAAQDNSSNTKKKVISYADFNNRACDLSFIHGPNDDKKKSILGVIYNDFAIIKSVVPGHYKCIKLPEQESISTDILDILDDFGNEHFFNGFQWTQNGEIDSISIDSLSTDSTYVKYNNIAPLWEQGKNFQGIFFKMEMSDSFNIKGEGVVLTKEKDVFKSFEFFGGETKKLYETSASKAFLSCIESDSELSKILHSSNKGRQGKFKSVQLDYEGTLVDEPRFLINYTLQEKKVSSSSNCFKLVGSK